MFKPLLRTLPSLSGNIKLACEINDYTNEGNNVYSTYIRSASLQPLQNNLYNRRINVNLINGMWEYDVAKFYKFYSNYFYKQNFSFLYDDFAKLDLTAYNSNSDSRNKDYEFGCKHISYNNTGYMFDFYAPIFINSVDDLPEYFEIRIDFENGEYKKIRININKESTNNYLKVYIEKYLNKINRNVAYFVSNTGRMIYYGIDVDNGGLVDIEDTHMAKYFTKNTTVNNFDSELCAGFMNNKLIMRQILPLSFHFNIEDILSSYDKLYFISHKMKITAYYYKDSLQCKFYDFDINYTNKDIIDSTYSTKYNRFVSNHRQTNKNGNTVNYNIVDNDSIFGLHEKFIKKYYYTNAITPMYGSWKMMFSSDSCPYITNINYVYTNETNSLYGQFPRLYNNYDYNKYAQLKGSNLVLFSDPISTGDSSSVIENKQMFNNIQNTYVSNWYTLLNVYTINNVFDILDNLNNWFKVENNYAYYKGILYNLTNCEHINDIDYFGVFIKPTYSEVNNSSNMYNVSVLNNCKESEDGSAVLGDVCINEQYNENKPITSTDFNKDEYVTDIFDFDNNYEYENYKIVNNSRGAKAKTIDENVIISKYSKSNIYNIDDIENKKLYTTIDLSNSNNKYVRLIDVFNNHLIENIFSSKKYVDDANLGVSTNSDLDKSMFSVIINNIIFGNDLNLTYENTFAYNIWRFSVLMLKKTSLYNSQYINNVDTYKGFVLNSEKDKQFFSNLNFSLIEGTEHKWNIFVDENKQVYEADVYISKHTLQSIVSYIINVINTICNSEIDRNKLTNKIINYNTTYNAYKDIVENCLTYICYHFVDIFNDMLENIDEYEFKFGNIVLKNNLSINEYYTTINNIQNAINNKQSYDTIINNQWPLTSIDVLLAHINGNTKENTQPKQELPNIHFVKSGYVEKIQKLASDNPFNVSLYADTMNYDKVLYIDAAYINKYERANTELYDKYYEYINTVYGDAYAFFDTYKELLNNSNKESIDNLETYNKQHVINNFDLLYNVGNYTSNVCIDKGPQYFFNFVGSDNTNFMQNHMLNINVFNKYNKIYNTTTNTNIFITPIIGNLTNNTINTINKYSIIENDLRYHFDKFNNESDAVKKRLEYDKYDKYLPSILTTELNQIMPSFDFNYSNKNSVSTYFTTILTKINAKNNLDRLKFEINTGAQITFKGDVLKQYGVSIYDNLKNTGKYTFDLSTQYSDQTYSYFYKYNINDANIYNILSTHSMKDTASLKGMESMNSTYVAYPGLYDNVMKLFIDNDDVYLFIGSPFLLLPGVLPFENSNRGINLSYSENNSNVKFGTIPFIQKDYINTKINILENADTIIKTIDMLDNLSTTTIEQNKDTNSRQINILFDNICDLVNSESLREKYDKYNPSSFNNNALFMFSDLGLATNYAKLDNVNIDAQNYPLYVYTNTFIGSAFATLQDLSTYYANRKNDSDQSEIDKKYDSNLLIALVSTLKNSYLNNVRNFSELLKLYKNSNTNINIDNIHKYVENTINYLVDQAYCYDKTWKDCLDTININISKKYNNIISDENLTDDEKQQAVSKIPEITYLNYILRQLTTISMTEDKTVMNKYLYQYSDQLQKYINDDLLKLLIQDITLDTTSDNNLDKINDIIYNVIWPLAQSMNIYRQMLKTIKLYKVSNRVFANETFDNNDMFKLTIQYNGEMYSKYMSTYTEDKLIESNSILSIEYNNNYSFKSMVEKKYKNDYLNTDFNYFNHIHEFIQTTIDQYNNYVDDKQTTSSTTNNDLYINLYSKKELLPLDEHLLANMTTNLYQYYIYELCEDIDNSSSLITFTEDELKTNIENNFGENIANNIVKINNSNKKIQYAKLFAQTENDVYKNSTDKNMLDSLLSDNHITSVNSNPSSIYGNIMCTNNKSYNVYKYVKNNISFALQLNDNDYSSLASIISNSLMSTYKDKIIDIENINDACRIVSDVIYVLLYNFTNIDSNSNHISLFKTNDFSTILNDIIVSIYNLMKELLNETKTGIDLSKDIYNKVYFNSTIGKSCAQLQNRLDIWYKDFWKTNDTYFDVSFENLIIDTDKNNRSLINIVKDVDNFRQQVSNSNNTINKLKVFRHIAINVCKNLPYGEYIVNIINGIYNVYDGNMTINDLIVQFINSVTLNNATSDSRHIIAQLINYLIVFDNLQLYYYVINNSVQFSSLDISSDKKHLLKDVIDNIDNNLHILERINQDGTITKFGYYCLSLNITNSSLHYNINSILQDNVLTFKSINNESINNDKESFIDRYFNLLYPLLKVDPLLSLLQQSKTLQKPYKFQQNVVLSSLQNNIEDYQTCYFKYNNGSHYIKELDHSYSLHNVNNVKTTQAITLNRYLNYIEPVIKETSTIYDFKSKMFKINNMIYSSQNLFTEDISINKYNPIIVFNKLDDYNTTLSAKNSSTKYYIYPNTSIRQYEYKHFNDNHLYMLENSFEYKTSRLYTYDELLKAETNTIVFELFKNYIIKRHNNITIDENEILFLFNRYNVTFKSDFVKLDITLSNKLYTLKYIFSLK